MPKLPVITCKLTDQYGTVLRPYAAGAIQYQELPIAQNRPEINCSNKMVNSACKLISFSSEGFITVYAENRSITHPLPFSIVKNIMLSIPDHAFLQFRTEGLCCHACVAYKEDGATYDVIRVFVSIQTSVYSEAWINLQVPELDASGKLSQRICIRTKQVFDSIVTKSETNINYMFHKLNANVSQYVARADGEKRVFTNSDELKEYGDKGILSPEEVSFYNVFVNGVPQPKKNFKMDNGHFTFTTTDIPGTGQPIMISFVTFECKNALDVIVFDYCAQYNGKRAFTDADALPEYSDCGIPAPEEVSYYNLYVNGVLQPQVNFFVKKGLLFLLSSDLPKKNEPILLESYVIRERSGNKLPAVTEQYVAQSDGGKVYTNRDSLSEYGRGKIENSSCVSFQNFFVNGTIQPEVNFSNRDGLLLVTSEDAPPKGEPIFLQSVTIYI